LAMASRREISGATLLVSLTITFVAASCSAIEENKPSNYNVAVFGSKVPPSNPVVTGTGVSSCSPPDAGACTTTFTKDIVPMLEKLNCGGDSPCHGGTSPPALKADKNTWYDSLKNMGTFDARTDKSFLASVAFINTCTQDPEEHPMYCNLAGCTVPGKKGNKMPLGVGHPVSEANKDILKAWIKCNSPR
jgi:hypothetical protein